MSSLNASLASALSGLIADQGSIAATTNNVANVNTPGYSREQPILVSIPPAAVPPLTFGTILPPASITPPTTSISSRPASI
jgi:flagellar hook-associated protein FlgK